ncbi:ADP-ribosylation factor-related protein 1 [Hordeum vulgare]|nr:ADP-ribosylation factor-related protein 1 [Hordeum vulgare]
MPKRNLAARDGEGGPESPNRHRTVNEDHARYLWENNLSVPWPSVVLPERWNLSESRVPVPQVPADGHERWQEIMRRRRILPLDLRLDPGFALTSDLWDRWFISGVVPEGRRWMYFASTGSRPRPPPPAAQEHAAPLPLEVVDQLPEDHAAASNSDEEHEPPA